MSPPSTRPAPGSRVADYDYELPDDRIARYPSERRDDSRLLVLDRRTGGLEHRRFRDVGGLFRPGDVVVLNESRVLRARLRGRKPTGADAEVLLVRPRPDWRRPGDGGGGPAGGGAGDPTGGGGGGDPTRAAAGKGEGGGGPRPTGSDAERPVPPRGEARDVLAGEDAADRVWEALVRPGGKLKPGRRVVVSDELEIAILDSTPQSGRIVRLETDLPMPEALERYGRVPLPPYLDRDDEPLDRERYQTVYAKVPGSVAAPTAGLHFTPGLLDDLRDRGVRLARVVLHVGVGTFRPVEADRPDEHEMHAELYSVPEETAATIRRAREREGRVWAVGTTVVRTLETVADPEGRVRAGGGSTDLFIHPPYRFRAVDALITNFHLPRSTLLMLVAAFGGYHRIMRAYRAAIDAGYRFYSYGDAMALV